MEGKISSVDVIERLLAFMASTSRVNRANLRYIYLAQFGAAIVPYCTNQYRHTRQADYRYDLVRFVLQYAPTCDSAIDFAIQALADRSKKVRQSACAVLAYSLKDEAQPALEVMLASKCKDTAADAARAIQCIEKQNHNLFYPTYTGWGIMPDDPNEPSTESVKRYIVNGAPELVDGLRRIYGDIFCKYAH